MKRIFLSLLVLSLIFSSGIVAAQEVKSIQLKDGSVIKGQLIELNNGVYTVKSSQLGTIQIKESDVLNIGTGSAAAANPTAAFGANQMMGGQVQQMQQNIMANPALMSDIEKLMENEELMNALMDPKLMNDLMTMDPTKVEGNTNFQKILNDPQMKQLLEKIQGQMVLPQ